MSDDMRHKKAYSPPALTRWGSLTDLTQTDWAALDADVRTGTALYVEGRRTRNRRRPEAIDLPHGNRRHFRLVTDPDPYRLRPPRLGGFAS